MKRKDELKALFLPPQQDKAALSSDEPSAPPPPVRQTASAVRTIGLNLRTLSADAEQARSLREQLDSGNTVVELDPEVVEPSFVSDRLIEMKDESFDALVSSIRENGQLVPILVRPDKNREKAFQVAYGHRRLRAAKSLGLKVRAVVRDLTDDQMAIAQGKENSERRDLTFIERALFAQNLEQRGFERRVLMAALSVDKAEITRLLGVARSVPTAIVQAIGPAPKAGRPRWLTLAKLLEGLEEDGVLDRILDSASFRQLASDRRFEMLLSALLTPGKQKNNFYQWSDSEGRQIVKVEPGRSKTILVFNENLAPRFAEYVAAKLDELHQGFKQELDQHDS